MSSNESNDRFRILLAALFGVVGFLLLKPLKKLFDTFT